MGRQEEKNDEFLAPTGRVLDSMLSEHQCQGWLEGYLLTGRHGVFNCYEAFIHIVDSMFNQHAKWLKVTSELPWRRRDLVPQLPAGLPRLAAGPQRVHAPGPRLPRPRRRTRRPTASASTFPPTPTASSSVFDHCLRSRNYVNVVVAGKRPLPQWLTVDAAVSHCTQGIGIWQWASNDQGSDPDVVHGVLRRLAHPRDPRRRLYPARAPA